QKSPNHRNYDYAIVSSDEIRRFYAEGFGISDEKVIATGIPRTDIFFDEEYGSKVSKEVYSQYPSLKDKKVILFAPTFRGMGKEDAFYPMDKFNIEELFDSLDNKEDYILIIKHHPFITKKTKIPDKYKNNVIDLSAKSEINDLLFVTNLLITDYSSVIFEASLLDIPMLFYGYDLDEYIRDRDFYYDYRAFVPGKIVKNFESLSESINSNDFDSYKVNEFKHRFFDDLDGKSSERVVSLINSLISQEDS
ncbi:MAG: CDP-glycerol glycerophosphotransferase family protein, partial [Methanobrevibacter sp.]|nr:CDP-glycerol glycerophosphotransferase family protein [Methanobrevibacter sp.]